MRSTNFLRSTIVGFALVAILGTAQVANSQGNTKQEREAAKRQAKIDKQQAKVDRMRIDIARRNQMEWMKQNSRLQADQRRQSEQYRRYDARTRTGQQIGLATRYRVYGNGSAYNTDERGLELLKQAVSTGYRKGFEIGAADRSNNRRPNWGNAADYRRASMGYDSHVSQNQYQYYFRQGFQRGYQDGSNSQYNDGYRGSYEYGFYDNGSMNILETILNGVLNIRNF